MTDYELFMKTRRTNRNKFFEDVKENTNFKNVSELQALRAKLTQTGKVKQ